MCNRPNMSRRIACGPPSSMSERIRKNFSYPRTVKDHFMNLTFTKKSIPIIPDTSHASKMDRVKYPYQRNYSRRPSHHRNKSFVQTRKHPSQTQKSLVQTRKHPSQAQKSLVQTRKHPSQTRKHPSQTQKSLVQTRKHPSQTRKYMSNNSDTMKSSCNDKIQRHMYQEYVKTQRN